MIDALAAELDGYAARIRRVRVSDPALAYEQLDDLRASLLGLAQRMRKAGQPLTDVNAERPVVKGWPDTIMVDRRPVRVEVRRKRIA